MISFAIITLSCEFAILLSQRTMIMNLNTYTRISRSSIISFYSLSCPCFAQLAKLNSCPLYFIYLFCQRPVLSKVERDWKTKIDKHENILYKLVFVSNKRGDNDDGGGIGSYSWTRKKEYSLVYSSRCSCVHLLI
jgi:hypothetical protein